MTRSLKGSMMTANVVVDFYPQLFYDAVEGVALNSGLFTKLSLKNFGKVKL